jgi:predicted DNA-binding transcriptional regulator YafY
VGAADRRERALQLLRRRANWTVAGLAAELGCSRRTILRDLGALRETGFDLDTFSGPGGGVRLNPTSVMITSQLRTDEVVALILSVEIARASQTVPYAAEAANALTKIERALPAARASELRALRERILIGDPAPNRSAPAPVGPDLVGPFEAAFASSRLLAFTYHDANGRTTRRVVEPHGLLVRAPLWYVIAWDTGKDAPRLFRADRITAPVVSSDTFIPRPDDLVTGVCPDGQPAGSKRGRGRTSVARDGGQEPR